MKKRTDLKMLIRSPVLLVLIWAICVPAAAIILAAVAIHYGPREKQGVEYVYLEPTANSDFYSIQINTDVDKTGARTYAFISIFGKTHDATAYVDLVSMQVVTASPANFMRDYRTIGPGYTSPRQLNASEVLNWFGYAKANTSNRLVVDAANELSSIINTIPKTGLSSLGTSHLVVKQYFPVKYYPAWWYTYTVCFLWLGLWIVGFIFHIRYVLLCSDSMNKCTTS